MPTAPLHIPPPASYSKQIYKNPLPPLIRLPSGLALLELQGTLNFPEQHESSAELEVDQYPIGTIIFPDATDDKVKMAYWYIGKTQRMTGEVKALGKPLAVLRKRRRGEEGGEGDVEMGGTTTITTGGNGGDNGEQEGEEELEVVDVVRFKIIFSSRPEPVT